MLHGNYLVNRRTISSATISWMPTCKCVLNPTHEQLNSDNTYWWFPEKNQCFSPNGSLQYTTLFCFLNQSVPRYGSRDCFSIFGKQKWGIFTYFDEIPTQESTLCSFFSHGPLTAGRPGSRTSEQQTRTQWGLFFCLFRPFTSVCVMLVCV